MKEIPLTQGKVALVSDGDFESVSRFKWFAASSRGRFEARRWERKDGGKRSILRMHVFVSGCSPVDHRDGNSLNNQRENLRPCTPVTNGQNRRIQHHSSRFKGVSFWNRRGKFGSFIRVNRKLVFLGWFDDEREAAKKYDHAAITHFGEFARTNEQMGAFLEL